MIQRIQSVYLVLIILIVATLCSINVLHLVFVEPEPEAKTTEYFLNLFYFTVKQNDRLIESHLQYGLIFLSSIVMGLSIYVLLNFKNRKKQILFTNVNLLAIVILITAFTVKPYLFVPNFSSEKLMLNSVIGMALFIFMLYLNVRVYYLIKKDEDLVRSADRIR